VLIVLPGDDEKAKKERMIFSTSMNLVQYLLNHENSCFVSCFFVTPWWAKFTKYRGVVKGEFRNFS